MNCYFNDSVNSFYLRCLRYFLTNALGFGKKIIKHPLKKDVFKRSSINYLYDFSEITSWSHLSFTRKISAIKTTLWKLFHNPILFHWFLIFSSILPHKIKNKICHWHFVGFCMLSEIWKTYWEFYRTEILIIIIFKRSSGISKN